MNAVIPEGDEIPMHGRARDMVVLGDGYPTPDIPGTPNPHWESDAAAYEMRKGPFLEMPTEDRSTPYARQYDTNVPAVKYPNKFFPGTNFERPNGNGR
jgi:hypothetical protein